MMYRPIKLDCFPLVGILVDLYPRANPAEAFPKIRRPVMLLPVFFVAGAVIFGLIGEIRRLSPTTREAVWDRDQGRCRLCGAPGDEIDHISDSSSALSNLQLLCTSCHQRKTRERMVPASAESKRRIGQLWRERVAPEEPTYLCDDQEQWAVRQRQLRKDRKEWLFIARLADADFDPDLGPTSAALIGFPAEEAEGLLVSLAATVTATRAVVSARTQP